MKYFKFVCYSLLLMLLFNTSSLYAAPPLDHTTHTPLSLMPEPLSGSHDTFSLAATWWLPDWQGGQGTRGSDDDGGGDIVKDDSDCMKHYNLYATCPSPKLSTGVVHPVAGMTCQKSCYCPSEYKYTSSNCSGKYTVSGGSCDGKYNACVCKSEYSQNSSNCNGEYRPAGESCDGNYNRCEMRPECAVSSLSCTYGCAGYNSCGKCTSCKSCPPSDPCSGVSCGSNAYCSGGSCYCNSGYTGNANSGCTKVDTCTYTTTASSCSSQCKNVGSSSCTKNGTTYYNGCGSSKCSSGQTCSNGTCVSTCNLPNCSSSVSSKPSNSSYTTKTCTDCSGTHTINTGWSCNSGYHKCGSSCIPTSQCCTGWDCDSGCCSGGRCVSCPTCYVISSDCTRGYGSSYYYVVDTCVDFDTGSSCGGSWGNTIENTFSTLYECQSSISSYKSNGCKN